MKSNGFPLRRDLRIFRRHGIIVAIPVPPISTQEGTK